MFPPSSVIFLIEKDRYLLAYSESEKQENCKAFFLEDQEDNIKQKIEPSSFVYKS